MSIATRMGYTKRDMILMAINTLLILSLLTVYCQNTGLEARKKRALALVNYDAKVVIDSLT